MKNHLFLKVGVDYNAFYRDMKFLHKYIKKKVIVCFGSYCAEGESMAMQY